MRRFDWVWPVVILASAAACGACTFAGVGGPVQAVAGLWFLGICPGMALVRPMRIRDPLMELTLAVALSITIDTIVASALVYGNAWSPDVGLAIILGITAVGVVLSLPRRTAPDMVRQT